MAFISLQIFLRIQEDFNIEKQFHFFSSVLK